MGAYSLCSWRSQSAIARLRAQLARRVTNVHSVDFVAKAGSSAVPATGESLGLYHVKTKYYICGSGSVVERCLAKADTAGSNPVFRSNVSTSVETFFLCPTGFEPARYSIQKTAQLWCAYLNKAVFVFSLIQLLFYNSSVYFSRQRSGVAFVGVYVHGKRVAGRYANDGISEY